MLYLDART
jgi:hypothetical protein